MSIINILNDNSLTSIEKRTRIENSLRTKDVLIKEIELTEKSLDDKQLAIVLEAMELVTRKNPEISDKKWLEFNQKFLSSTSNNLKRESARVIGNIAHLFPNNLEPAIKELLKNLKDPGTVIRWSSAYAFASIITIPNHANSSLYQTISRICEQEENSGVKNLLLKGLKRASRLKK